MKIRKILVLAFFAAFAYSICTTEVSARTSDYTTFSEIYMTSGKLLENYTNSDYGDYYRSVMKRKFIGWRTRMVNENIEADFISEKLYSFHNDGTSDIEYTLNTVEESIVKTSISASGTIKYSLDTVSSCKKFKNGLDVEVKMEYSYTETASLKETEKIEIVVEPNTTCNIYITGKAKVTNGVAARYFFWVRKEKGGFEYFTITEMYPRIEIVET